MRKTSLFEFFIPPVFKQYRGWFFYALWSVLYYLVFPRILWAGVAADVRQGNMLYNQQEYPKAIEKYHEALQNDSESDMINFNTGAALYQTGDYAQAQEHFQKALLSEDAALKQSAHYNLGNTLYRLAEGVGPQNPQAAVEPLEHSLVQYEQALKIDPQDQDARANYQFVQHVLEKVREQIRQQQSQCQNSQSQNSSNSENQSGQREQDSQQEQRQQSSRGQGQQNSQDRQEQDGQRGQGAEESLQPQLPDQTAAQEMRPKPDQPHDPSANGQKDSDQDSPQSPNTEQGDQGSASSGQPDSANQRDSASAGGADARESAEAQEEISRREAGMRLDDYERNQQPRELLNLRGAVDARPVEKDW